MKHDIELKSKFKTLKLKLQMPTWQVKGVLQSIWDLAAANAEQGDVGRLDNDEIAAAIEYGGDIVALLEALADTHWLDRHPQCRYVIHDWCDHAPDFIKKRLTRAGLPFITADGLFFSKPTLENGGQRPTTADNGGQRPPVSADVPYNVTERNVTEPNINSDTSYLVPSDSARDRPEPPPAAEPEPASEGKPDDPPVLDYPVKGRPGTWTLTESRLAQYERLYPGLDVLHECRKARQWCIDKPAKRKTARGMPAFLTSWLSRANDRPGRQPPEETSPWPEPPALDSDFMLDALKMQREDTGLSNDVHFVTNGEDVWTLPLAPGETATGRWERVSHPRPEEARHDLRG